MNKILQIVYSFFSETEATPTPKSIRDIFGAPTKPPGGPNFQNPVEGISDIIVFGIRMFLIVGSLSTLFYLLSGAYDFITSGSDPEKVKQASDKMRNATIGVILMVVAIGVFTVISGDILGLIRLGGDGDWSFSLPTID